MEGAGEGKATITDKFMVPLCYNEECQLELGKSKQNDKAPYPRITIKS